MTFHLINFINIEHQFASLAKFSTKDKLAEITFDHLRSETSIDIDRIRAISKISDLLRSWSLEWTTNKSLFKRALKRFENHFLSENSEDQSFKYLIIKYSRHDMSKQVSFSSFNQANADIEFSFAQLTDLTRLITQVMNSRQSNISANPESQETFDQRHFKNWSIEKIDFFDSAIEEIESLINVEKHVFYRDVYAFTDRLRNMIVIKEKHKLKTVLLQCLRKSALIWHFIELFDLKKIMLKKISLDMWYTAMIKRFKKRTSMTLINMQITKFFFENALHKNSKMFAQDFFRYAKAANLTSVHNQLIIAWNNLAWQFRQHISKSTKKTTMRKFLKQLNSHVSMWHEMTTSKTKSRSKSHYYQNFSERNNNRYFNRDVRISLKSNNAYQNTRQNNPRNDRDRDRERSSRIKITTRIKKKQSSEREFDNFRNKDYDKRDRYRKKSFEKFKIKNKEKNKDKVKTFLTKDAEKNSDNLKNYYQSENLSYFDLDYEQEDAKISAHLVTSLASQCRQCKASFSSNNRLHQHLRTKDKACAITRTSAFNNEVDQDNFDTFIIESRIDFNKDIDSEYEFKEWQYAIIDLNLFKNESLLSECIDTDAEITLTDFKYFTSNFKDVSIRTITTLITIRDLNVQRHTINKYVIASIYFPNTDDKDRAVKALISKKFI